MAQFGLVGENLAHSFSKQFFENKWSNEKIFNHVYQELCFPDPESFKAFKTQSSHRYSGLNVTIPYKQTAFELCDTLSDEAREIGAVNCIKIIGDQWHGFNTDAWGFYDAMSHWPLSPKKALVLGSGGASKAVVYILEKNGIVCHTVSRKSQNATYTYAQLNAPLLNQYGLIVNCTPLGTFPNVNQSPDIPYTGINSQHCCIDLIYNPEKTRFLQLCEQQGAQIKNGLDMLVNQALASWNIWTN